MSPALVLLPALPPMRGQLVLEPRPLFVVLDLVAPVAAKRACKAKRAKVPKTPAPLASSQVTLLRPWYLVPRRPSVPRSKGRSLGPGASPQERRQAKGLRLLVIQDRDPAAPKTRQHCYLAVRPCPFVGCTAHLKYEENQENGALKDNWPEVEFDELEETCSLDVAEQGPQTPVRVARLLNITKQRVQQIESGGLRDIAEKLGGEEAGITADHVRAVLEMIANGEG